MGEARNRGTYEERKAQARRKAGRADWALAAILIGAVALVWVTAAIFVWAVG